ncbi:MAG TPA: type I 3-dehydroquinate dehydratase [Holophaga sp.]|nr:type I 3-dehydroquinate dehydratase [Holophaga sp.]HPS66335.1 type I 3-dehydroquinate dehydratase [Holophaga sp.]
MNQPPFYVVPLTHASWDEAQASARLLPPEAIPELRLDLFPDLEPEEMIRGLRRFCVVTHRRACEGGAWEGSEEDRLARLAAAAEARPAWIDLEWDLAVPEPIRNHRSHVRLLRSVHVPPGVFDLEARLAALPEGEAYKWVGHAGRLSDNARLKPALAWARDRGIPLSAFLMGPKGVPSRCMQAAWGGAFTYAAPDDGPPAAPGQLPLATLRAWRLHKLHPRHELCGVLGSPVMHSRGPAYHNARFQAAFKDLVYLPLDCGSADEACEALERLGILGASLTAPLKETLPPRLGLRGPLNTLWRRAPGLPWQSANTDAVALREALGRLAPGPVLVLGAGGVAHTTFEVLREQGRPWLGASRAEPGSPSGIAQLAPVGVVQATSLGMQAGDPRPFPELLEAARPTLRWAVEWIYKEETAFARWSREAGLTLVEGGTLFEGQASAQSRAFVEGCGE